MSTFKLSPKTAVRSAMELLAPRLLYRFRIYLRRDLEPEVRLLPYLCQKERVSIDVGANFGLYSHHMLRYSVGVKAFEPVPDLYDQLRKQYGSRLEIFPVALSDQTGECELRLPGDNAARATIESHNTLSVNSGERIVQHKVMRRRLDDYEFANVGFIKIDVEGHEEAVLQGSLKTISTQRPNLLIEIEESHNPGAIGRVSLLLSELGYSGYFVANGKLKAIQEFDLRRDQPIDHLSTTDESRGYINNFIFVQEGTLPKDIRLA